MACPHLLLHCIWNSLPQKARIFPAQERKHATLLQLKMEDQHSDGAMLCRDGVIAQVVVVDVAQHVKDEGPVMGQDVCIGGLRSASAKTCCGFLVLAICIIVHDERAVVESMGRE